MQRRDILAVHIAADPALALDLAIFLMIDREAGYTGEKSGFSLSAIHPMDPAPDFRTPEAAAAVALAQAASPAPAATPVPRSRRRLRPPVAAWTTAAAGGDNGRRSRRGIGVISQGPPLGPSRSGGRACAGGAQLSMFAITCLMRV